MRALILAGGSGSRLSLGEKPLVMVDGVPMISRIITAFQKAGCEVVVVLSPRTPFTNIWCRAHDILHYVASGTG
ncbi:MAG: NTP transferase domain-containing protein, partial [Methanoregulaceae archaeon]